MASGIGAELAKRLGIFVVGNLILWGGAKIIKNKLDGKTWLGKKKKAETIKDTYVDWRGNVVLGVKDGWVV